MKAMTFLLASLISTTLMATTTVKIPLTVEESVNKKSVIVSTAEINKRYKLQGDEKLLETMVVTLDKKSLDGAHDLYWAQNSKADDIATKYKGNFSLTLLSPSDDLCYIGSASEAVDIIGSLADGPFSDQMGFWGWKYKSETHFVDADDNSDTLNKESKLWKNWKGNDETILLISHFSDDGDDVSEALITKCK